VGEASVEPHPQARAGKPGPQLVDEPPQEAAHASRRRAGPRAQDRADQELVPFVVERDRRNQRQIAPGVVEGVEEGELLLPVGSRSSTALSSTAPPSELPDGRSSGIGPMRLSAWSAGQALFARTTSWTSQPRTFSSLSNWSTDFR
jgi:hypothetical protein